MALGLAERKAWETYLAVATGLLPLADAGEEHSAVGARLDAVAVLIRRYAPLWSDEGAMLRAAVDSATRLHLGHDRGGLTAILRLIAGRLYLLSTAPRPAHRAGYRNERPWDRRFTL